MVHSALFKPRTPANPGGNAFCFFGQRGTKRCAAPLPPGLVHHLHPSTIPAAGTASRGSSPAPRDGNGLPGRISAPGTSPRVKMTRRDFIGVTRSQRIGRQHPLPSPGMIPREQNTAHPGPRTALWWLQHPPSSQLSPRRVTALLTLARTSICLLAVSLSAAGRYFLIPLPGLPSQPFQVVFNVLWGMPGWLTLNPLATSSFCFMILLYFAISWHSLCLKGP